MRTHWLFSAYPAEDAPSPVGTLLGGVLLLLGCVSIFGAAIPLAFPAGGLAAVFLWAGFGFLFIQTLPALAFCIRPRLLGGLLGRGLRNRLRNLPDGASWRSIELHTVWLGLSTTLICWLLSLLQTKTFRESSWGGIAVGFCILMAIIPPLVVSVWAWRVQQRGHLH